MPISPRERIMAAIAHERLDRVPTDYWGTHEMNVKLLDAFNTKDMADIWRTLDIDKIMGVGPAYIGPPTLPDENFWGMKYLYVEHAGGSYYEQVYYPLAQASSIDDLERYQWPSADWFDYSGMEKACDAMPDFAIETGYYAIFFYHIQLRGLENALVDPLVDPEFTEALLSRIDAFLAETCVRSMEATKGKAQLTQVTDDYGSQTGPIMNPNIFRKFYLPYVKKAIERAHALGFKVLHHDDGSMRAFLPDLVEAGIDILNPVQWRCPGMELTNLKADFGKDICFHGGVDNQEVLPFGTPEEVAKEVRRNIEALACDGTGYILAPCHNLQGNTPVENVVAMYEAAHRYGRFSG